MTTAPAIKPLTPAQLHIAKHMSEKALQANITRQAKFMRWHVYHTWNSLHSQRGFPDLLMLKDGRGLAVELKREGADLPDEQRAWLEEFAKVRGFDAYCWRPSDWLTGRVEKALT